MFLQVCKMHTSCFFHLQRFLFFPLYLSLFRWWFALISLWDSSLRTKTTKMVIPRWFSSTATRSIVLFTNIHILFSEDAFHYREERRSIGVNRWRRRRWRARTFRSIFHRKTNEQTGGSLFLSRELVSWELRGWRYYQSYHLTTCPGRNEGENKNLDWWFQQGPIYIHAIWSKIFIICLLYPLPSLVFIFM